MEGLSTRAAYALVGGAAVLAGAVWLWRRFGVGYSDGVPTGVVRLEEVQGVAVPAQEAPVVRQLLADAARDGVALSLNSAFRGMAHQVWLWAQYELGLRADQAARPGYSNHQRAVRERTRGPALDISVQRSTTSREFLWLQRNGARYGLKPVGVAFGEPWHFELTKG